MMSVAPPGANPTSMRTGLEGYCVPCAAAAQLAIASARPSTKRMRVRMSYLLLDDPVGAIENRQRKGDADRPCGSLIDEQLEQGGLLDRELGRARAPKDALDVGYGFCPVLSEVGAVAHQTAVAGRERARPHRRHLVLQQEAHDLPSRRAQQHVGLDQQG